MTPPDLTSGMSRYWTVYESPLGPLTLIGGPEGLVALRFTAPGGAPAHGEHRPELFDEAVAQLHGYFAGSRRNFDLRLDLGGTPFQRAVWTQLAAIPYGKTRSYGRLAQLLGRPDRARAVGAAVGATPVPIIVPCHRAVAANGALTGYIGGLHRKRLLLDLEHACASGEPVRTIWRPGSSRCCDQESSLRLPTGRTDPWVDWGRVGAVERSVILHTDIPTRAQVDRLLGDRDPASVSIYLPTDPASSGEAERIEFFNLAVEAVGQLRDGGVERERVVAVEEELADLGDDEEFWRYQARSLGVFVTPVALRSFRLANRLVSAVEVSDRFFVKPLLRALTFPHVAFVLALAQGSVRVIEVAGDVEPSEVAVEGMPADVASAAGRASIADRAPHRRIQGSEGQKVMMRKYARRIDQALRPFLSGLDVPLILAASEPMDSIFRSVNSYPQLAPATIAGNPEGTPDAQLAQRARVVLDDLYADELRQLHELYGLRASEGRALADIAEVARAATYGAVDTVLVDIDEVVPGSVDERTGAVTFADAGPDRYGVVDEIARRVWLAGGRVLAVRRDDIPGRTPVAAILRYALG